LLGSSTSLSEDPNMNQAPALASIRTESSADLAAIYALRQPEALATLPGAVLKIVELLDGKRPLAEVCASAQISEEKAVAVVRKLSKLGIIARTADTRSRTLMSCLEEAATLREIVAPRTPGFTAAEEAFFASEVQPIDLCDEPFSASLGEKVSGFLSELVLKLKRDAAL